MEKNSSTQVRRPSAAVRLGYAACVLVVAAAVAGCGLVKVGYRHGDLVGMFMIDRYLDLSSEQTAFVKPRLHQLLVWHKTTQLPDYVGFVEELQRYSSRSITTEEVVTIGVQARQKAMTTIDHAMPEMTELALRLTPDNIKALEKRFADDDAKWRREFMKGDVEKQQKARYERTLERVEEWYGRFNSEQRDRIRQLSDARPFNNEIMIAERERRQHDFVALLAKVAHDKPPRDAVIAMMKNYADRFDKNPDPERRAFLDSLRLSTEEMEAAIQNLSTPQQRTHAAARLQEWIDDFKSLSADPNA
jgi:hypothetical protein